MKRNGGADAETASQQFIFAELELARTLMRSAGLEFAGGRRRRGFAIQAKVQRICVEIERRLEKSEERGWDVAALRARFTTIQNALATLDRQLREAA